MRPYSGRQLRFARSVLLVTCVCGGGGCASAPRAVPLGPFATPRSGAAPRAVPAGTPAPDAASAPQPSMRDKLDQILIPSIDFKNAPIEAVIEELNRISREADPEGAGVNIILMPGRSPAPLHQRPTASAPPIRLTLRRVSLHDALRILCRVADLQMHTRPDGIRLYPQGAAPKTLETRVYPVTPAMLPVRLTPLRVGPR